MNTSPNYKRYRYFKKFNLTNFQLDINYESMSSANRTQAPKLPKGRSFVFL